MNVVERDKINAKKKHYKPRKLARSVAHDVFMCFGYDNVDKPFLYKGVMMPSYFSTHWRENVTSNHSRDKHIKSGRGRKSGKTIS